MKKRKLLLVFVIFVIGFTIKSYAQAPQQFNYQGAARNSNGTPLANKSISLRISILNGSSDGSAQYSEVRNVTTNALGLYNIAIGSPGAASVTGSIAGVTWQNGSKFIKVEVDPNNGSNFNLAGTAQLLSVPYAMYAGNGGSSTPETITVLKDNGDGTYTYTSEDKTITVINVTGSVKSNIQNILADNAVKVAIAQLVNQSAGNVSYDATNKTFTYKDPQGNTQNIDLAQVTKASQTVTTLTKNGNTSVYTYTNEVGATVDIDVIGDVKNNFSNIANDPAVKTALQQVAGTTTEVVKFNAGNNQFTYTDASGKPQTLDLGQLVKSNQTITTLTKDPATAIYTYTSEDGTKVNIDVVGDVKGKISDILNDPAAKTALQEVAGKTTEVVKYNAGTNQFTYIDASGNPQTVDLGKLTKDNETTTTITKDAATSIYTYTNEKGATVNIDVVGDVKGNISTILSDPAVKTALQDVAGKTTEVVKYNAGTNQFTYTDASGNAQTVDLGKLTKDNETTTTITKDAATSIYTYTNEKGATVNIDVVGDVKGKISDILNDPAAKTALQEVAGKTTEVVKYNAGTNQFTYTDASGNPQTVDLGKLTKDNETTTTITKDAATSIYTYTNEKGATVNIDVVGDVKGNISTILSDPAVKTALQDVAGKTTEVVKYNAGTNQFTYTDASGNSQVVDLNQLVKSNETTTTITKDAATAIYTYTNEKGATVNIDVVGDVKGKISDILSDPAVKTALQDVAGKTTEVVKYNAGTNQFTYTDATMRFSRATSHWLEHSKNK